MTINERIFNYRKRAGLTQEQAAERMDMKTSTYAKMELKGKIDSEKLLKLAELFGVTPEILLCGDESVNNKENYQHKLGRDQDRDNILRQEPPKIAVTEYIPTNRELSAMKIIHNLPKNVRNKVFDYIEKINETYK